MVTHPRTPPRPHRLRPLNLPRPVQVEEAPVGWPHAVWLGQRRCEVIGVRDDWRIDDEWWRQEIARHYFDLVLRGGDQLTVFQDLVTGRWYTQRATRPATATLVPAPAATTGSVHGATGLRDPQPVAS